MAGAHQLAHPRHRAQPLPTNSPAHRPHASSSPVSLAHGWQVYHSTLVSPDLAQRDKIIGSLGLTIAPRDLSHADTAVTLRAIMGAWLPLAPAVRRRIGRPLCFL